MSRKDEKTILIKEGSYGCAFTPPLRCRKSRKQTRRSTQRQVGKISLKKNVEVELSIGNLVKGIPKSEDYFIVAEEDTCSPQNFQDAREKVQGVCSIFRKAKDSNLIQILTPYGGASLERYQITESFPVVPFFKHVLEGVRKLGEAGICHFDIHEGNILMDKHGVPRFIDFGTSFLGDLTTEITIKKHNYDFDADWQPFAPEFHLRLAARDGIPFPIAVREMLRKKKVFTLAQQFLGMDVLQEERKLLAFASRTFEWDIPFFKRYWHGWDSYAIASVMLRILSRCFNFPSFVNGTWRTMRIPLTQVLKGLLASVPEERMSAAQALTILEAASAASPATVSHTAR